MQPSPQQARLCSDAAARSSPIHVHQVPFSLLATAYRRKRILEGLIGGDKVLTAQVVAMAAEGAERGARQAVAEAAAASAKTTKGVHAATVITAEHCYKQGRGHCVVCL
jgi:hypothetical protein